MPFTPAHPALVIPLLKIDKRYLSATGLVVGSMAPDFEYFFKMRINSNHSHTLLGLFYFDLPITILLSFIFHEVVKKNLIQNLPGFFQSRLGELLNLDFRSYAVSHPFAIVISALVGSFLHLFWDSFTHPGGFFVDQLPIYDSVVPFDGIKYPLYYALQTISTLIGLAVVTVYVLRLKPDPQAVVAKVRIEYWLFVIATVVVVLTLRFGWHRWGASLETWVVSFISAFCIALILAGLLKRNPLTTHDG